MLWGRSTKARGFRYVKRDAQSDLQRSEPVLQAVVAAISSLDLEMAGLGRRVDELRAWVGSLIGPEDGSNNARDPRIEAKLVDAEGQLMRGVKRLSDLAAIRSTYRVLQDTITAERTRASQASQANG